MSKATRVWVTVFGNPVCPIIVSHEYRAKPRESDLSRIYIDIPYGVGLGEEEPVDIVAAAVAAERERCAQVCEQLMVEYLHDGDQGHAEAAAECIAAIRRGGE